MSNQSASEEGVFHIQADTEEEFERKRLDLAERVHKLAQEQRERLSANARGAWWADAVFLVRDLKGVCQVLQVRGEDDLAELVAELSAKSTLALLKALYKGDGEEADKAARELVAEGDVLDAVVEKALTGTEFAHAGSAKQVQ